MRTSVAAATLDTDTVVPVALPTAAAKAALSTAVATCAVEAPVATSWTMQKLTPTVPVKRRLRHPETTALLMCAAHKEEPTVAPQPADARELTSAVRAADPAVAHAAAPVHAALPLRLATAQTSCTTLAATSCAVLPKVALALAT